MVRHPVLREGKPIESCHFEDDDLETTQHFGLHLKQELVGIISLFKKNNPAFPEKKQYQIRGMAVLEEHRKKDFGKALIIYGEDYCKKQGAYRIWFNARMEAVDFYKKMGYQSLGIPFEIKDVGKHVLMFKIIHNV